MSNSTVSSSSSKKMITALIFTQSAGVSCLQLQPVSTHPFAGASFSSARGSEISAPNKSIESCKTLGFKLPAFEQLHPEAQPMEGPYPDAMTDDDKEYSDFSEFLSGVSKNTMPKYDSGKTERDLMEVGGPCSDLEDGDSDFDEFFSGLSTMSQYGTGNTDTKQTTVITPAAQRKMDVYGVLMTWFSMCLAMVMFLSEFIK